MFFMSALKKWVILRLRSQERSLKITQALFEIPNSSAGIAIVSNLYASGDFLRKRYVQGTGYAYADRVWRTFAQISHRRTHVKIESNWL
jgi:hypothetical protein